MGVLACATAVLGLVIGRQCWQQRKSRKACHTGESPIIIVSCHNLTSGAGPDARNVVYDEVILPPTSSSAVIPMQLMSLTQGPCSPFTMTDSMAFAIHY